jgi:hypothetical protein
VLSRAHGAKFVKWTPSRDHRAEPCWPLARRGVTDLPPSPLMRQSPSDGTLPNPRRKTRSSPPCAECRSRIDLPELRTDRNSAVPSRTDLHTVNLAHVKYVFHYFHAWRGRVARATRRGANLAGSRHARATDYFAHLPSPHRTRQARCFVVSLRSREAAPQGTFPGADGRSRRRLLGARGVTSAARLGRIPGR